MYKYSRPCKRNALLPIKFHCSAWAFVDNPHTNDIRVTGFGTWFHIYAKTCIQGKTIVRGQERLGKPGLEKNGYSLSNWKDSTGNQYRYMLY